MQKQRTLVIAAVAVAAMIVLVALFGREQRATTEIGAGAGNWLPELQGALADLTKVRLQSGATVSTLVRGEKGWGVEERAGYAVDFTRLGSLLRDLAEAKPVEQKTSKPEHFGRLGLEDIDKPDSKAVLVEIWEGGEQPAWRVLVGNAAEGRGGRYVRLADGTDTWLVDRSPQALAEPTDWIDRTLLGIDFERVARLERTLPEGGFAAARANREQPSLAAEGLPAGKKPRYDTVFDSAVRAVLNAEPEDVRRAAEAGFDAADAKPVRNTLSTFEGLALEIDALKGKDGNWIRVHARAGEPLAIATSPVTADEATEGGADGADAKPAFGTVPETAPAAAAAATSGEAAPAEPKPDPAKTLADEVATLNARLDGWAYKVSDYVGGELAKAMSEYIEDDKPAEAGDASQPAAASDGQPR
jgi:hypothetical protein